jgi:hypothetical protein
MLHSSPISRRAFLAGAATSAVTAGLAWAQADPGGSARYLAAASAAAPLVQMSEFGRRAPFGWQVDGIPPLRQSGELELKWRAVEPRPGASRFRLCVLDGREAQTSVEAHLGICGRVLGRFDLRWVADFQLFEIHLNTGDTAAVLREGVRFRKTGGSWDEPMHLVLAGAVHAAVKRSPDQSKPAAGRLFPRPRQGGTERNSQDPQPVQAACGACHPAASNCGLDVERTDTPFLSITSRHNIHTMACRDCHPQGPPKATTSHGKTPEPKP